MLKLEDLLSFLRFHELEFKEEEFAKKSKSIALKSNKASSSKELQIYVETDESSGKEINEGSNNEMSFISKCVCQIWKKQCIHKTILKEIAKREEGDQGEVSSHLLQMQEVLHYHSECLKLTKETPKKGYFKGKGLITTWVY